MGRAGTLITIDCVLEQLGEEKVVDIAGVIIHLRTQRMKMVQSLVRRLEYLILVSSSYIHKGKGIHNKLFKLMNYLL